MKRNVEKCEQTLTHSHLRSYSEQPSTNEKDRDVHKHFEWQQWIF